MRKISIREMKRSRLPSVDALLENVAKGRGSSFMHELTDRPKIFQILFAQGDSHEKPRRATFLKVNKYRV